VMFEERAELVYFLDDGRTREFIAGVSRHVEPERFQPSGQDVTTLYFDSDSRALARACESGIGGVRLRMRTYHDAGREPLLWLEVKTRSGASTRKIRFPMASHDMRTLLRDGVITEHAFQSQNWQESAQPVVREIVELCTHTAAPLRPDCMVHYRRQAWQDVEHTLRITLDTELAFHRPPTDPFDPGLALSEPPVARLGHSLVEIKQRGKQPAWLDELIHEVGLELAFGGRHAFSKFVAASHAVHDSAGADSADSSNVHSRSSAQT
jgi:hypothetical protein